MKAGMYLRITWIGRLPSDAQSRLGETGPKGRSSGVRLGGSTSEAMMSFKINKVRKKVLPSWIQARPRAPVKAEVVNCKYDGLVV
jgi:hypothetical protein